MPRPNVAPRPQCRYYTTPRGCFAGPNCHYLHDNPTHAPYEVNKVCRFFAQGYCKRGHECWFAHVSDGGGGGGGAAAAKREEEGCGICFEERPALYGLLSGCSHAFCLKCIRQWRDPEGKSIDMQESTTHKTCPMCRKMTQFITPSNMLRTEYYPQDDPRKAEIIEKYKQSMARVPCRHFARSEPAKRFCPFGRDCFYQHTNADGTPYVFKDGVDVMMPQWQRGRGREESDAAGAPEDLPRDPLIAAFEVLESFARELPDDNDSEEEYGTDVLSLTRRVIGEMQSVMVRLLGPSQNEGGGAQERSEAVDDDGESGGGAAVSRPQTPPGVPAGGGSAEMAESEDPRTPANATRPTELVSADFAWMMAGGNEHEGGDAGTGADCSDCSNGQG